MIPETPKPRPDVRLPRLPALLPLLWCSEPFVPSRALGRSSQPTFMRSDICIFECRLLVTLSLLPIFWLIWASKFQSSSSRESDLTEFVSDIFSMERSATEVAQLRRPREPNESRVDGLERLLFFEHSMRCVSPSSSSVWGGKIESPGYSATCSGAGFTTAAVVVLLLMAAAMAASMVASPKVWATGATLEVAVDCCFFLLVAPSRPLISKEGGGVGVAKVLDSSRSEGFRIFSKLVRLVGFSWVSFSAASSLSSFSSTFFSSATSSFTTSAFSSSAFFPTSQLFSPSSFSLSLSRLMSINPRGASIENDSRSELADPMDSSFSEFLAAEELFGLAPLEGTLGETFALELPPHLRLGALGLRLGLAARTSSEASCIDKLLKLISTLSADASKSSSTCPSGGLMARLALAVSPRDMSPYEMRRSESTIEGFSLLNFSNAALALVMLTSTSSTSSSKSSSSHSCFFVLVLFLLLLLTTPTCGAFWDFASPKFFQSL
mmetsp:Transcript_15185/g.28306  ORF Transcript_15185/g.28306 Transcript_15185/m.28306 type:complete len:494 (-) Transcript_15185:955-2436(-)